MSGNDDNNKKPATATRTTKSRKIMATKIIQQLEIVTNEPTS